MSTMLDRRTANLMADLPGWFGPAVRWSTALAIREGSRWPGMVRRLPIWALAAFLAVYARARGHV